MNFAEPDPEYLEELESRLYSQVFHSCAEEPNPTHITGDVEAPTTNSKKCRYFEKKRKENVLPSFIPISNKWEASVAQSNITIYPGSSSIHNKFRGIVQNNITVNQYTFPFASNKNKVASNINVWPQDDYNVKRRQKRREQRARKKRKKSLKHNFSNISDEIICLSDDSDDVRVISKDKSPLKKDEIKDNATTESDEDIIYIPPALPEIINIDADETCDTIIQNNLPPKSDKPEEVVENAEPVSNDFLDNTIDRSEKFNFGLHGADFSTQTNGFVRPTNPVDYCETESSCSTIDQTREFNNSVKTIVFDEIEFPREDIFAEKNLESFKTFITPQRNSITHRNKETQSSSSSGDSSSESDYENESTPRNTKTLPNLSLMQPESEETGDVSSVIESDHSKTPKKSKKRNQDFVELSQPIVDLPEDNPQLQKGEIISPQVKRKQKQIASESVDVTNKPSIPRPKVLIIPEVESEHDENPSGTEDSFLSNLIILDEVEGDVNANAKKKRKRKSCSEKYDSEIIDCSGIQEISSSYNNSVLVNDSPIVLSELEIIDSDRDSDLPENVGQDLQLINLVSNSNKKLNASTSSKYCDRTIVDTSNFDIETIHGTQSDDPEFWQILHKDRATYLNIDRQRGPRCNRCRHFGHTAIKCTEKSEPPSCYLCGEPDHQEPRCPNKICTQCATPGQYSTTYCWNCFKFRNIECHICGLKGHLSKMCPDLWRRYHLTTEKGPIVAASSFKLKPRDQQWCSGCARQGHLEHECNYHQRAYPPSLPYIVTYEDVLNNQPAVDNVNQESPRRNYHSSLPQVHSATPNNNNFNVPLQTSLPSSIQNQPITNQQTIPPLLGIPVPNPMLNNQLTIQGNFPPILPSLEQASISSETSNQVDKNVMMKSSTLQYIKNLFMTASLPKLQDYLRKEIQELDVCCPKDHPQNMRKLLLVVEKLSSRKKKTKVEQEKVFLGYRTLNMYIFGYNQMRDGNRHISALRYFLTQKNGVLDERKRKKLLDSYLFIFGPEKHSHNYVKVLKILQRRYE